jgi:hypothetical protein
MKKLTAVLIVIAVFAMSVVAQTTGEKYFTVYFPERIVKSASGEFKTDLIPEDCLEVKLSPGYSGQAPWISISLQANRDSKTSSYGYLSMRPSSSYKYYYDRIDGENYRVLYIRDTDGEFRHAITIAVPTHIKNKFPSIFVSNESNPASKGQWTAYLYPSDGELLMKWMLQYFEAYKYTKFKGCLYLDF